MPVLGGRSGTSVPLLLFFTAVFISTFQHCGKLTARLYRHIILTLTAREMAKSTSGDVTVAAAAFFFFSHHLKYCSVGGFLFQLIDDDIEFFPPLKTELRVMMLVLYVSFHQWRLIL